MAGEMTYEEAVELFNILEGSGNYERWAEATSKWGQDVGTEGVLRWIDEKYGTTTYKEYYQKPTIAGEAFEPVKNTAGNTTGYTVTWSGASRNNPVDSNYSSRINPRTPINTTATIVEEKDVMTFKVGLREAGNFLVKSVAPAVVASSMGISLGKSIDSTLYNLHPDFWDSHGMRSLDPTTWDSITAEDDSLGGAVFDLIFGVNADGTSQAYLDEDSAAYLAWWLAEQGVFDSAVATASISDELLDTFPEGCPNGFGLYDTSSYTSSNYPGGPSTVTICGCPYSNNTATVRKTTFVCKTPHSSGLVRNTTGAVFVSTEPFKYGMTVASLNSTPVTINGETFHYGVTYINNSQGVYDFSPIIGNVSDIIEWNSVSNLTRLAPYIAYIMEYGTIARPTTIDGITDQPDAVLPNVSDWNDVDSTKRSLQDQYPTLWDDAKHYDYVDEDGQNTGRTLIPINFPIIKGADDTKPVSGERTQDEPLIDPTTATKDLIDTLTKFITGIPTMNPPTTGSGDGPAVITPTGNASSLWAIYNPTQNQLNAFGAWLWDSSFVEQIKKLFNDPMQAIIGVHKVFATPSIGGTATIKVGYLDSQVSSAYIDDQYTTVNCGTVNLSEYFGNVFDYSPYTRVSLYLPFIGIVDLDVADVMRSSINVTYHVDVLSGACLADVKVTRDLGSAVLYQYSGSAIVTYPVSSGNYMGMVAGVLSVAGGVLGTIASGGALAPALIGGAVGASHLHTNVSHSGGFSGCAGAMGGKIPYIIVSRPQTAMADNYGHFTGKPANSHVILKDCGGMTRVKSVYVGNMNATDEEKNMIEAQLKAGVLV